MQINRVRKPKLLQQGSVFSLDKLSFNDSKSNKNKTMSDFYPEIDLSETNYGVVLSQTCDLYKDENEKRNVKLGVMNENEVIITSGITEKDEIYLVPPDTIDEQ